MEAAQENRLPLELMTQKATEILAKKEEGFFLMVEASQVDWEGHDNDGDGIIAEMHDMNNALKYMLDFQEKNPDVLVAWVADHETGGMALGENENGLEPLFATGGHTATMVTAFAKGPGEEHFRGSYDNTEFGKKLISLLE
jgi:alkaline phosphatase